MNIEISDEVVEKMVADELMKIKTKLWWGDSSLERAVQLSVRTLVKDEIMKLLKSEPKYVELLEKNVHESIATAFQMLAQRVSKTICEGIEEGLSREFPPPD